MRRAAKLTVAVIMPMTDVKGVPPRVYRKVLLRDKLSSTAALGGPIVPMNSSVSRTTGA